MTGNDRDRREQPPDQRPDEESERSSDAPEDAPKRPGDGQQRPEDAPNRSRGAPSEVSDGRGDRGPDRGRADRPHQNQGGDGPDRAPRRGDRPPGPERGRKPPEEEVLIETHPTTRPALLRIGLSVALGITVVVVLLTNPELLGSRDTTDIALVLTQILLFIALVRLAIRLLVLRRTVYTITPYGVKREYSLLFRKETREIPFQLVRSYEFDQSRIETLLGYGTIAINQGLGQIKLENIQDPDEVYQIITEQIARS